MQSVSYEFRVLIDGAQRGLSAQTLTGTNSVSMTRFIEADLPIGGYTIALQVRSVFTNGAVISSAMTILGAKR